MGAADIVRGALQSEVVRNQIGEAGVRIFKSTFEDQQSDDDGGFLGWLWNAGTRFLGSLLQEAFKLLSFSFTALWGLFVSTTQFIWNFNWQMSDTEIDNQIKSRWAVIAGLLGGTLGNAIGYLACGITPAATIFAFNEPLGAYVLKNVAEEFAEELVANLSNLIRYTFMSSMQNVLLVNFKNARKFLKANADFIGKIFGENAEKVIRAWGEPGSKPWSFAKAIDDAVESIPNRLVRDFVEEFLEEAWDGCVEAGYVVANSLDTYVAQQKLQPPGGQTRLVEIQPDRSIENERIILAGPEQHLKSAVVQTLSQYQLNENRDMGTFIGMPADDYLRAKPQTVRVVITFHSVQQPPWRRESGQRLVTATYAIPDVKIPKLDWETIKRVCGGANGYMWGRFRCTGTLSNGRQMQVMGATAEEAEDRLRAFLELTDATLVKKPTPSEDKAEDNTGSYLKQPTRIYPAYFTVMNQYRVAGGRGSGVPMSDGIYKRRNERILLWTDTKPLGTDELIQELLKKPGAEQGS